MKFIALLFVVTLVACSEQSLPSPAVPTLAVASPFSTLPSSPSSRTASLYVYAIVLEKNGSGACIRDATLQIVRGQGASPEIVTQEPCDYWDPPGFALKNLDPVELTLRFSAPGFVSVELTTLPSADPNDVKLIELSRISTH